MFPRQFSIRTLLVMVTLVAVCLASHRVHQLWYARNYPGHYLYGLLHTRVRNGDTWQEVTRHFDKAVRVDASSNPNVQKLWNSRRWTMGPDDEIWHFAHSSGRGVYLQFRDGQIVNYQSNDFADPDVLAQMNHDPLPPVVLRRGVWPICIFVLFIAGCVLVVMDKKKRSRAETNT